jgi:predicted Fe-Mo cluster-binding NifX family protein
MKIAISSDGESIESAVDQRFGRCKYFLIVEIDGKEIKGVKAVENEGAIQGHGAGIKAAQQIGDLGVEAVITGNLGPNATNVLGELGIKAYQASGPAREALEKFISDGLEEIKEIAPAHSGAQPDKGTSERIFFPLLEDKGMDSEISQHFGHAPFFGLYDTGTKELKITENTLDHTDPDKSPVDQIVEAVNPTTVFALGIGGRAIGLFNEKGIALKTGDYKTVKEAIENLDKLEEQTQSCGH